MNIHSANLPNKSSDQLISTVTKDHGLKKNVGTQLLDILKKHTKPK